MTTVEPAETHSPVPHAEVPDRWRWLALGVVALRFAVPLAAIPAIPWLIYRNISLLVLLRPQKEFLLVGGGQSRYLGEPELLTLFLAFVPLGLLTVPAFFLVGRAYGSRLREGTGPAWLQRAINPRHLELGQRVLARRGPAIAILGRFAALPPTLLAAAAGVSDVSWRAYLAADALGAVLATSAAIGVGYTLGRAYQNGGTWLTVVGVILFGVMIALLTYWLRREADRDDTPAADPTAVPAGDPVEPSSM
jgi:membrane protein DedA with SNARE-associated domain